MSPAAHTDVPDMRTDDTKPMVIEEVDYVHYISTTVVPPVVKPENNKCPTKNMEDATQTNSLISQATKKRALISQFLMNGAIIILVTGSGMPIGFSAILLPQIQAPNSTLPTDDDWASWIASVHSIMTPIGSVLAGPMMDRWGRRRVLQLSVIPMVAGWLLMSIAPNHVCLAVGRMLAGFAVGMGPGPSQVLIGEISEPRLRGVFSSAPGVAYSLGILLVYALGSLLPWRMVAATATLLPIAGFFVFIFLPESPVWLVNTGQVDEAKKSLMWLRGGNHTKVNHELHLLIVHSKLEQDRQSAAAAGDAEDQGTLCLPLINCWQAMTRPEVFKPFFIILIFCFLQILSGSYIVIFYGVTLISSASGGNEQDLNSLTIAVMSALVRFIVSIVTTVCLLRLGRRKIGIISGTGTAFACFLLVTFLQLKKRKEFQTDFDTAIIATLIMIYVALNTFGIFALPCMMIGEVLPSSVRGFVSGILLMLINLMIFSTTKLYPYVSKDLGPCGVFLTFAIVAIIITVYVYLFLPETKNRPLTQIEQYFANGKNYLWVTRDKSLMARRHTIISTVTP